MTTYATPAAFILACLDADEGVARAASVGPSGHAIAGQPGYEYDRVAHGVINSPAATWVRCKALREVVALHGARMECGVCLREMTHDDEDYDGNRYASPWMWSSPCPTLRALAAMFDTRDGWDEGWR